MTKILGVEGYNIVANGERIEKDIKKVWLKFYDSHVRATLSYPEIPLFELLESSSKKFSDNIICNFLGKELKYREMDILSDKVASYLYELGIGKGDKVIINLPNTPHYIATYYGILKTGAIVVQSNPLYTEREIRYVAENSEAKVGFFIDFSYPRIRKLIDEKVIEKVVICKIDDYLKFPLNIFYKLYKLKELKKRVKIEDRKEIIFWRDVIEYRPSKRREEINPREDVAVFQYTGGTTGIPKAVMLTHFNLIANVKQVIEWLPYKSDKEVFAGALPYFHSFGMTTSMNAPITLGAKIIIFPDPRDIKRVLSYIHKYRITIMCGVPTFFNAIVNHPKVRNYDLSSLKACISGAAPLPIELKREFEAVTGAKLIEGYGLSESSPVTHANPFNGINKERSIGIPFPDTLAVIVNEEGRILSAGEIGEIAIKGPQVMKGYYKMSEETAKTLINGWLLTGDIAKMDEDGYFYIVDRKKDLIIAGGYNVYPREVEEVLYEHPAVIEAAVIGVPDKYRGETVKAFIVLREEYRGKVKEEEIIKFCKERLAPYKVPKIVEIRDELPKSAIGKILRRALREEEISKLGGKF